MPIHRRLRATHRWWVAVVTAGGTVMTIAGCGSGAPSSATAVTAVTATPVPAAAAPAATAAASPAAGAASAPDPNAPEVNAAGDIPDNQVFVPFSPPGGGFAVSVPEGWARSSDGPATVFTDKFNSVRVESALRSAAADVAGTRSTDVPQLQGTVPGFVLGDVRTVSRAAGSAVLITYQADSAPNPVTGKSVREAVERYAFWRAGRQVVLTLAGPTGADDVDPWRIVTNSLRWQA
jgi:hypothetical protein